MERFHCITQLLAHKSPVISRIVFPYSRLTVLVNGPCPCHCLDCRVYTWQWETQTNVKLVYFNHKPVTGRHTYVCTYVHIQICTYIYTYIHTYIHTYIEALALFPGLPRLQFWIACSMQKRREKVASFPGAARLSLAVRNSRRGPGLIHHVMCAAGVILRHTRYCKIAVLQR